MKRMWRLRLWLKHSERAVYLFAGINNAGLILAGLVLRQPIFLVVLFPTDLLIWLPMLVRRSRD